MATLQEDVHFFCLDCGYDLRAIDSERCPECGWVINRDARGVSRIPWVHRKEMGWWKAYWRTVWLGTWRIKHLAAETNVPVIEDDARRFARVTAILTLLPFSVAVLIGILLNGGTQFLNPFSDNGVTFVPHAADITLPFAAGITRVLMMPISVAISIWLLAGSKRVFFTRSALSPVLEDRAAALSHYTVAPLVIAPFGLGIWSSGAALADALNTMRGVVSDLLLTALSAGGVLVFISVLGCWINVMRLQRRTMRASATRIVITAIGLPVLWGVYAIIAFLIVPWIVGLLWLMIDSLRN